MKTILKLLFGILFFANIATAEEEPLYLKARGNLIDISKQVAYAISKTRVKFNAWGGKYLDQDVALLDPSITNKWIAILEIKKNYNVRMVFASTPHIIPELRNKRILLLPVYDSGDLTITSFDCATDADKDTRAFEGAAAPEPGLSLFFKEITREVSPYLDKCTYLDDNSFNLLWDEE